MRISDWSSDVCSSDLFLNGEFPKFDFTAFTDFGKFAEQWEKFDFAKVADQFKLPGFDAQALVAYQKRNLEAVASANKITLEGAQAVIRQIGRTSGRERVCQSV